MTSDDRIEAFNILGRIFEKYLESNLPGQQPSPDTDHSETDSRSAFYTEILENAVNEAAKTIRDISGVHVISCTAKVEKNKIVEYRAVVKISFTVERVS